MQTLSVAQRFCGPPRSANGGYFAGVFAAAARETLRVRLVRPPPLDTELSVVQQAAGVLEVHGGEGLIAQAWPAELDLAIPCDAPSYVEAAQASRHYAGFSQHAYPTCFVCGPQRPRGDGMRIFAGPIPELQLVAAPWVPDASLDGGDGKVRPEIMSAALDCPGYFANVTHRVMLLGEITVRIHRLVHVDESCTVIGWPLGASGRKREVGTAIFDEDGELCAAARALWIEPRESGQAGEEGSVAGGTRETSS